ncbi:MAG: selenocysteine protein [Calditrichaeota bacterium]|nr:selenocysteine protein [Calditrichota bacterium]
MELLWHTFVHAVKISLFVFLMMVLIDYLNVKTRGHLKELVRGRKWRQYSLSSFLAATPGCLGAFMDVSLYVHGLISFGALTGAMVATSGDEAFVMLAMFPEKALLLFAGLFLLGIVLGWVTDVLVKRFHVRPCDSCQLQEYHPQENSTRHYLTVHIWKHIFKKHIIRVFLWTFGALLVVNLGLSYWNLESFVKENVVWIGVLAVLVGIIPESGPNLIFITLYAKGLIPISVLIANSIVQDGHGMLPMLSYSLKDSVRIKAFNMAYGILIGGAIYLWGH